MLKAAIIGGYGGMGKFFAKLFKDEGFSVTISGPSEVKGEKVAKELEVKYFRENKKAAKGADIVLISVPILVTLDVIREVAPVVKDGALLMDVTSLKENPCREMQKHAGKKVEIIGTHPIFSHRVGSIDGQVFVLTPIRVKKWLPWLREFLHKRKAKVYISTPEEHDRIMAVVQGLTHFTYISAGSVLKEMDFDIKESRKFSSPIYELMLDIVGRIIGQNPSLYAAIQMENPRVGEVHKAFMKCAGELAERVKEKDTNGFVRIMAEAATHFGDVDQAMGRSDKAISSLISELEQLKNSIGREICLEHIYSGKKHIGVVEEVTPEKVVLGNSKELKISNVRVLPDSERIEYKKALLGTISRDFSAVFNKEVDENFLSRILQDYDENILSVKIKDIYKGKQIGEGEKSICFSVTFLNSRVKELEKKVEKFLLGLGGRLR